MNSLATQKLSYGLYVLTTSVEEKPFGCIVNSAFQITSQPARMAVSCNRNNFTHDKIVQSGVFGITVLPEHTDASFISTFGYRSGRHENKFSGISFIKGTETGVPLLPEVGMTTFECRVIKTMEVGTHTLFIGEIVEAAVTQPDAREMTYRYFHEVLKGSAPKNAPTYIQEPETEDSSYGLERWKCSVCGYIYDSAAEGVRFEDLADTWSCPVCGVSREHFEKEQ